MINSCVAIKNNNISFKQTRKKTNIPYKDYAQYALTGLGALSAVSVAILAIKTKHTKADYSFKNLIKQSRLTGLNKPQDFIKECIEENIIGTGANSKVYKFSNRKMQNWVIKIDKKCSREAGLPQKITEIKDEFGNINMGQEIASIGENVHILKRIQGNPHSIQNWSAHRASKAPITQQDASGFLENIENIAAFPQESFNNYAKKLKILDEQGYKADSFNPNNYLIDFKNKELHIIDAYKYYVDANMNTKYDLLCPLIDYPNYERYYNVMLPEQKQKYIATTAIINQKCTKAAEQIGLSTSESTFREFISRIDSRENNGGMYTKSFESMKQISKV